MIDSKPDKTYSAIQARFVIAPRDSAGSLWSGLIDDVRIYNRAVRP